MTLRPETLGPCAADVPAPRAEYLVHVEEGSRSSRDGRATLRAYTVHAYPEDMEAMVWALRQLYMRVQVRAWSGQGFVGVFE